MNKAIELLKKAQEVLSKHWFTPGDDGEEYNNEEVIQMDREISEYLISLDK